MIPVIIIFLLGGMIGWLRAARLGGDTKDRAQYAFVHAIGLSLLALLAGIILLRWI